MATIPNDPYANYYDRPFGLGAPAVNNNPLSSQFPDQQAAGQQTDNQMSGSDDGSNPGVINWDQVESQGQGINTAQPAIDNTNAAYTYWQQQQAAAAALAAQQQANYQAQINAQMQIEQAKLAEQGREFNQGQVGTFADQLMKETGPKDPYSYLFNSAGLAAPQGYAPAQLALPQAVLDAYKAQGIDQATLQKWLTGSGQSNPMTAGYLGGMNQQAFQGAQGMPQLAPNAAMATDQAVNPIAGPQQQYAQPQAQPQSALVQMLASHPNADQFIASHPQFPQMVASHPQFAQANNPVMQPPAQSNPVGGASVQPAPPVAPIGASGANPMAPLGGGPHKEPSLIGVANLTGGLAPDTSTAKPPMDVSKLDPYTQSLVNSHGVPGAPSAYQLANMPPSGVQAYTDYVNNIAGGNMNDLMDKAKAMFPVAGAAQATNYQGPVQ